MKKPPLFILLMFLAQNLFSVPPSTSNAEEIQWHHNNFLTGSITLQNDNNLAITVTLPKKDAPFTGFLGILTSYYSGRGTVARDRNGNFKLNLGEKYSEYGTTDHMFYLLCNAAHGIVLATPSLGRTIDSDLKNHSVTYDKDRRTFNLTIPTTG